MSLDPVFQVLQDKSLQCDNCQASSAASCIIPWVRYENSKQQYLFKDMCDHCWSYLMNQACFPVKGENEDDVWVSLDLPGDVYEKDEEIVCLQEPRLLKKPTV